MKTEPLSYFSRAISLWVVLCFLSACGSSDPQSPEERVMHTLSLLEEAVERRSVSDFMQHVAEDYQDHQGHSKKDIRRLIQLQYVRNQNIHILSKINELNIQDDLATVELSAAMASSAAALGGDITRLKADTHQFSIVLRSLDNQQSWLIESVAWERGWN
jgi:hypothetical protein